MKLLLIIKIIYFLCKYDIESIKPFSGNVYKKNRFVNIYILDRNLLLKQFLTFEHYSIIKPLYDNLNILFLRKSSFGYKYIIYCISLIPKWFTIENRKSNKFPILPKIYDIDKKTLNYKEEFVKTILRYDCFYTKKRVNDIIDNNLKEFSIRLSESNMVFVFLERKNICITKNGKLKIIEGELWTLNQFKSISNIIKTWYPSYEFKKYDDFPNIYL